MENNKDNINNDNNEKDGTNDKLPFQLSPSWSPDEERVFNYFYSVKKIIK